MAIPSNSRGALETICRTHPDFGWPEFVVQDEGPQYDKTWTSYCTVVIQKSGQVIQGRGIDKKKTTAQNVSADEVRKQLQKLIDEEGSEAFGFVDKTKKVIKRKTPDGQVETITLNAKRPKKKKPTNPASFFFLLDLRSGTASLDYVAEKTQESEIHVFGKIDQIEPRPGVLIVPHHLKDDELDQLDVHMIFFAGQQAYLWAEVDQPVIIMSTQPQLALLERLLLDYNLTNVKFVSSHSDLVSVVTAEIQRRAYQNASSAVSSPASTPASPSYPAPTPTSHVLTPLPKAAPPAPANSSATSGGAGHKHGVGYHRGGGQPQGHGRGRGYGRGQAAAPPAVMTNQYLYGTAPAHGASHNTGISTGFDFASSMAFDPNQVYSMYPPAAGYASNSTDSFPNLNAFPQPNMSSQYYDPNIYPQYG
eukprot:TRINITY_DN8482_c0_g1_i1.p1 TRINITY_DN8482_c0_g1~~TRINITY_DN8482_c0_g1_i1.p1  ORF type:complete len:420 (+),score=67.97 TRINITY_DN8482_c0_g1_i1:79-1338(+)